MNLKEEFTTQVRSEIKRCLSLRNTVHPAALTDLPDAVQRHFFYCGFSDVKNIFNARISWDKLLLKNKPASRGMTVSCDQFNSVIDPVRIAYMKSISGIPLEGKDEFFNGHGRMQVRLVKLIPVANTRGPEMDKSALVTLLAETMLVPSYAIQPYIKWAPVDELTSKATIIYNDIRVSGTFHFAENGACVKFRTNDRFMQKKKLAYNCPWEAHFEKYRLYNEIMIPSVLHAVWKTADGDFNYASGNLTRIDYNIESMDL